MSTDGRINLAGYSGNDAKEEDSVTILRELLNQRDFFKVYFSERDKAPNFDGFFEILSDSEKTVPIGRIDVQIKTLPECYVASKDNQPSKYKYSCDTKVFNAALRNITLNPIILFLIDTKERRVFWRHVSDRYAKDLDIKNIVEKTIYFNDTDLIGNVAGFRGRCIAILEQKSNQMASLSSNLLLCDNVSADAQFEILHEIVRVNDIFDKEIDFAKPHPDPFWKIGMSVAESPRAITTYLFKITLNDDGKIIRHFEENFLDRFPDCLPIHISIHSKYGKSSLETARGVLDDLLQKSFSQCLEMDKIPLSLFPDDALAEIVFDFWDRLVRTIPSLSGSSKYNFEDKMTLKEARKIIEDHHFSTNIRHLLALSALESHGVSEIRRMWGRDVVLRDGASREVDVFIAKLQICYNELIRSVFPSSWNKYSVKEAITLYPVNGGFFFTYAPSDKYTISKSMELYPGDHLDMRISLNCLHAKGYARVKGISGYFEHFVGNGNALYEHLKELLYVRFCLANDLSVEKKKLRGMLPLYGSELQ